MSPAATEAITRPWVAVVMSNWSLIQSTVRFSR